MQIAGAQIPRWIPMVIPPRDWVAPNIGGYLSQQPLIMRTRGASAQTSHLMEQHTQGKMQRVRSLHKVQCQSRLLCVSTFAHFLYMSLPE